MAEWTNQTTLGSVATNINTLPSTINNGTSGLYYDATNTQLVWGNYTTSVDPCCSDDGVDELCKLPYTITFSIDNKNQLDNNILKIREKYFSFRCQLNSDNSIEPYEYLMELIENKTKMNVKIKVSDVLTINYSGLRFTKIKNNLSFGDNCDFSELKVKFKYDKILFENHRLTPKQQRVKKIQKITNEGNSY